MNRQAELISLIDRYATEEGANATPLPYLYLTRQSRPREPFHGVQVPALCLVAQGRKKVMLGERIYPYDPSQYLVISADLPVIGHVVEASEERPYLGLRFDIDQALLAAVALELNEEGGAGEAPGSGILVSSLTDEILDAAIRLLRLLDNPRDAAMLAPLVEREILYRLLVGEQSARLHQIARADSKLAQVNRAIVWIRKNYTRPFRIETVAAEARMSPSALHEHFKSVTAMSPLQYQKQIRLQEARRLIVGEALDAASAAHRVGYDSPSQFSREYSRLFGAPPLRDAARLRASPDFQVAV